MYRFVIIMMGMIIGFGIAGCGDDHDTDTSGNDYVSITASKTELYQGESCFLTAVVKNNTGKEVAGREVAFGFVTNESGASFTSAKASTNAAGEARVLYVAGTNAGSDIVRASLSNGSMMDVNIVVAEGGFSVTVAADPSSLAAGEMSSITASVKNAKGNPVSAGQAVNFYFLINSSGASLAPIWDGLTDANGQATAIYTAGYNASDRTVQDCISATIGSNSGIKIITRTAGTANFYSVGLTANPSGFTGNWIGVTVESILTAAVVNGAGSPVRGMTVTFSIESGGGSLSSATAVTNTKGEAAVRYINTVPGPVGTKYFVVLKASLPDGTYSMITMEIDA